MKKIGTLCFAFILSCSLFAQKEEPPHPETLKIGSKAPNFSLMGTDSLIYSLESFADAKVLAIVFSCNHCPTAQAYEQRIIDLQKDFKDKGVQVIMVSPNDPTAVSLNELGYTDLNDGFDDMKIRAAHMNYNFPYLYDGDTQEMSKAYGPRATPHLFLFDQSRILRYRGRLDAKEKPGTANAEDARNALKAMLEGQAPELAQTKTFGCSIKWSWKNAWKQKLEKQWAELPVDLEEIDEFAIRELLKNGDSDKLRLINVWATWCGPCVMEFPSFIEMDRMYRHRNFEFVSISADRASAKPQALKLLKKWEASNQNFIINFDDKYALIEAIDPAWNGALPYTVLVAPNGEIVFRQEGSIDPLAIKRAIVDHDLMGRVY